MCFLQSLVGGLLAGLLLASDGLARTLAGACVGVRPLATDWESLAVTQALVAADLDLAADIGGHLTAKIAFNLEVLVDPVAQGDELVVGEVLLAKVRADSGRVEGLGRL